PKTPRRSSPPFAESRRSWNRLRPKTLPTRSGSRRRSAARAASGWGRPTFASRCSCRRLSRSEVRALGLGVTHGLDDVAEQQARKGCQLTLGQDELLPQRRYRSEIAAGELVEKCNATAVLTA